MASKTKEYFKSAYPTYWQKASKKRTSIFHHQEYQRETISIIDPNVNITGKLLEVGCADGELLMKVRGRYPLLQLVGLDIGKESIEFAKEVRFKGDSNVNFVIADANQLPFSDSIFDFVLMSSVSWYLEDTDTTIREIRRVLKPGGRFVIDFRNPLHINNFVTAVSMAIRRIVNVGHMKYSYYSLSNLEKTFNSKLFQKVIIEGYYPVLPIRISKLSTCDWLWKNLKYGPYFNKIILRTCQKFVVAGNT